MTRGRILLVDDDSDLRQSTAQGLDLAGFEVTDTDAPSSTMVVWNASASRSSSVQSLVKQMKARARTPTCWLQLSPQPSSVAAATARSTSSGCSRAQVE